MISRLKQSLVVILLLRGTLGSALAAELGADTELRPDETRAIQPNLGIGFAFDSNIYNANTSEIESWIGIVTPAILFSTAPAQQRYALLYEGQYAYFLGDSPLNYADHIASGLARFELSSRAQLDFAAVTEKGHRNRGSDQTGGLDPSLPLVPIEPDLFDRKKWSGKFRYGAEGNRGRLRFGVGGNRLDYTNNLERTQTYDYESLSGNVGLSLLFHQRTAIVLDAVFTDIGYESTAPGATSRDSEDWRYLIGLTWAATAKTVGSIRFGIQQRRFDDPALAKTSNPSWDVDVRWSPRPYSHFDFVSSRENQESYGEGAFIDSIEYEVTWTHQWGRGWDSIIRLTQSDFEFVDSLRTQDLSEFYLGLRYPQGRLLTWEAGYAWRSRDSSISSYISDGNMFSIGLNIGY